MTKLLAVLLTLQLVFGCVYADSSLQEYKLGIFPYLPTARILKAYAPIAEDVEKTLGVPVILRTKASYEHFQKALFGEEYDIAFIQPYDYIEVYGKHNYLPLVRRSVSLNTVLIVKIDSPYQTLEQLRGQVITSPAKHAAVSQITNLTLEDHGFNLTKDITRTYKKNHFACMQSVIIGEAAACGTADRALKHFGDIKMKNKFRVLVEAKSIPNSLFVVHKRVPADVREKLAQSIINWPNTDAGKVILAGGKIVPMVRAFDSDYDVIR